jgi:hypothetical protein
MTSTLPTRPSPARGTRRTHLLSVAGLVVALAATTVLVIVGGPAEPEPAPRSGRTSAAAAWPAAQLSAIADLPMWPLLFLDTATVVGTQPSDDEQFLRLLLRGPDGAPRELRRLSTADNPRFENLTVAGDDVVWTEFADGGPPEIWAANVADGGAARRLTAETGNGVFHGSEYDLVHHAGRVYWAAESEDGTTTEIRSVALSGGRVQVAREPGQWTMAPWPWLDDGASGGAGATLLRNTSTGREITVPTTGGEFAACTPSWCRVLVINGDDLGRIDLMRPDGSARREIAGGAARTALPDVAILDRFEFFAEPGPNSDSTGTAALVVYDIFTGDTVELAPAANEAQSRNGLVWWYTSGAGAAQWHVLDLRTI